MIFPLYRVEASIATCTSFRCFSSKKWNNFTNLMLQLFVKKYMLFINYRKIGKVGESRIPGLTRFGKAWAIPKDAERPADARKTKSVKRDMDRERMQLRNAPCKGELPCYVQANTNKS